MFSIPAIKGARVRSGPAARRVGSGCDCIALDKQVGFVRTSNNAGARRRHDHGHAPHRMRPPKPIPTLMTPLRR
ncbi:MAG: hypothetical protein ACLSVD_12595 [Eggerthellaceae bacterium]